MGSLGYVGLLPATFSSLTRACAEQASVGTGNNERKRREGVYRPREVFMGRMRLLLGRMEMQGVRVSSILSLDGRECLLGGRDSDEPIDGDSFRTSDVGCSIREGYEMRILH